MNKSYFGQNHPKLVQGRYTVALRGLSVNKIGSYEFLWEDMNCKMRYFTDFEISIYLRHSDDLIPLGQIFPEGSSSKIGVFAKSGYFWYNIQDEL